jgi:hypothetical protein
VPKTIISEELISAYGSTDYRVFEEDGGFVLRIGQRSSELARLFELTGKSGATFITAENPFSQVTAATMNNTNQARLRYDLVAIGATLLDGAGHGQDPAWPPEASYLAIGVSLAQASELGRNYGQNAIIWADEGAVPELVLLR